MMRYLLALLLLTGCLNEAQDRVVRQPAPKGVYAFKTRCRLWERCLHDAKDICPHGYRKEDVAEHELTFSCIGRPDW